MPDTAQPHPALPNQPPSAPTAQQEARSQDWQRLAALARQEVPTSVDAWKGGLSGLVSTAGAGLLLVKLPDAATIDAAWKVWIIVVAGVATVAGLASMWAALTATAGNPANITREQFEKAYSSFDDFVARRLSAAVRRLDIARVCAVISVAALLVAACLLWFAPVEQSLRVKVEVGDKTVCGTVASGDHGELRVEVSGERDARVIPYSDVRNLRVVATC